VDVKRLHKPGRYGDGGGLYLRIAQSELKDGAAISKNWVFRFERFGRERFMGLGSARTLSLAEARVAAHECRKTLLDGIDPIEARHSKRQQAKLEAARSITFRECAERYIAAHRVGWKNPAHAAQWPSTLAAYVYPTIGALPVDEIDTALVAKCIEPIWTEKPDTAGRVRGRIEQVLDWAKARGYRDGENPARWRGHMENLLPHRSKLKRTRKHHAALPYADAPAFMAELRAQNDVSSRALEYTILTASRTSETIGAKWSEISFEEKLWTVPAARIKGGRVHYVPLSDRAIEILQNLPRVEGCDFIFPGGRNNNAPLSNMAMLEKMRGLRPGLTVHGTARSTFRDWSGDCTNYDRETIETALAHAVEDETEAAYRRSSAVSKRRRLMAEWARYCAQPPVKKGNKVIAISSPPGRK
jgi:integrase